MPFIADVVHFNSKSAGDSHAILLKNISAGSFHLSLLHALRSHRSRKIPISVSATPFLDATPRTIVPAVVSTKAMP